ncbi:MAG: hypothetical protein GWN71_38125, partial [Gammaproteobacteria bacterium]|nr:hypothetical protein [Gemmatimonadota bacterium]NIU79164.1 hypothetical protein [Gammaproteobacteria bacterium]
VLGDIHASGDELRIIAELVNGRNGAVLARADVRGPRDSLFDMLDTLALSLTENLQTVEDTVRVR